MFLELMESIKIDGARNYGLNSQMNGWRYKFLIGKTER